MLTKMDPTWRWDLLSGNMQKNLNHWVLVRRNDNEK